MVEPGKWDSAQTSPLWRCPPMAVHFDLILDSARTGPDTEHQVLVEGPPGTLWGQVETDAAIEGGRTAAAIFKVGLDGSGYRIFWPLRSGRSSRVTFVRPLGGRNSHVFGHSGDISLQGMFVIELDDASRRPALRFSRPEAKAIRLTWDDGMLQEADSSAGPWTPVDDSGSHQVEAWGHNVSFVWPSRDNNERP